MSLSASLPEEHFPLLNNVRNSKQLNLNRHSINRTYIDASGIEQVEHEDPRVKLNRHSVRRSAIMPPLPEDIENKPLFSRISTVLKLRLLWVVQWLTYSNETLTIHQIHFWSVVLGIVGASISYIYQCALDATIELLWKVIPRALRDHTPIFTSNWFPEWNYLWMVPSLMGILVGILIYFLPPAGNLPALIEKLHRRGNVDLVPFSPMLIISLFSIAAGGSAGPEASIIIIMGSVAGQLGIWLKQPVRVRRTLSFAGMSAGLSAFFGLPLGGALFVLEVPHRMGLQYYESITPAIVSSLVSALVLKLEKNETDNRYLLPALPKEITASSYLVCGLMGVVAAIIAILFTYYVHFLKHVVKKGPIQNPILLSVLGGLLVGWIAALYPPTLFWGETELQTMIDRGATPLPRIDSRLTGIIHLNKSYDKWDCLQIAIAKMIAIGVTVAGGWPGGVIFPLFFAGAAWANFATLIIPNLNENLAVICFMSALESSITRTPWASAIIVQELVRVEEVKNHMITALAPLLLATYVAIFLTRKFRFYSADIQHSRRDIQFREGLEHMDIHIDPEADPDLKVPAANLLGWSKKKKRIITNSLSTPEVNRMDSTVLQTIRPMS